MELGHLFLNVSELCNGLSLRCVRRDAYFLQLVDASDNLEFSFASLHLVALSTGCHQRAQRQFPDVSSILGKEPIRTCGIHSAQIKL